MNNDDYSGLRELCDPLTGEVFWVKNEHLLLDQDRASLNPLFNNELQEKKLPNLVTKVTKNGNPVASKMMQKCIKNDAVSKPERALWMKAHPEAIYYKLSEARVSGNSQVLMWAVASFAGWRGISRCSQRQLSEKTGMAKSHVSRGISQLIEADVMIRIGMSRYRLNPALFWVGTDEDQKAAVQSYYRHRDRLEKQASMDAARSREMDTPEGRRKNFKVISGQ